MPTPQEEIESLRDQVHTLWVLIAILITSIFGALCPIWSLLAQIRNLLSHII